MTFPTVDGRRRRADLGLVLQRTLGSQRCAAGELRRDEWIWRSAKRRLAERAKASEATHGAKTTYALVVGWAPRSTGVTTSTYCSHVFELLILSDFSIIIVVLAKEMVVSSGIG